MLESIFSKVAGLIRCNCIQKRLQHRCFPVKFGKFLRTPFFTKHLQWLLLRVSGWPMLRELNWYVGKIKYTRRVFIFKKSLIVPKIYILSLKMAFLMKKFLLSISYLSSLTFLFLLTKFRFFLFFSNKADMKKWNFFKHYDVSTINFFRMSHTLKRKLFMFGKKKTKT